MKWPKLKRTEQPAAVEAANTRDRVIYQAAAWCLSYPDEELRSRAPMIRAALAEQSNGTSGKGAAAGTASGTSNQDPGEAFEPVLQDLENAELADIQASYVQEFDLSRRHALHLSYWTDGDTRNRGEVLAEFKQVYRQYDVLVDTHGELPDYLPMVLEFAATVNLEAGRELLLKFRPSVELLRLALADAKLSHTGVVQAICNTLPGPSPTDRNAVMEMARTGPPVESVGLDPYDPRLLPLSTSKGP
ncbi:MAG TPA: nitrate reductase molybdenum cofactor assembly chaperone [Arthrobacter sp.]|nr:nitrate reductase molybdenum cofactor assembly chaperone [Arthrobacter sp.]